MKKSGLSNILENKIEYDGWVLKHLDEETVEVSPSGLSMIDLKVKILFCERYAKQFNKKLQFKLISNQMPDTLDAILKSQGYTMGMVNYILTRDFLECYPNYGLDCEMHFVQQNHPRFLELKKQLSLDSVETGQKACFCEVFFNGISVGVAFATIHDSKMGIFNVFVAETYRGQGIGEKLICSLLRWGASSGADSAYLNVSVSNTPAIGLYSKLGFVQEYRMWKRVQP